MKFRIGIFLVFFGFINSNAQDFNQILVAGKEDASLYIGNYTEPMIEGLIQNLNSGWYHSGKTHKKYGFDFTINATASFIPQNKKTFIFRNSNYNVLELDNGNTQENLPTVMGPTTTEQIKVVIPLDALGNVIPQGSTVLPTSFKVAKFDALNGIEDELPIDAVPSPMLQVGIGLPSKTDFKIRFVPNIGNDEVNFNLIGIGLQHNLLQYFKLDKTTPFDVSILGAFTSSTTTYKPKNNRFPGRNQESTFKISAYTVQLVGNLNLKVINFYGGLGYSAGTSKVEVKGTYEFTYDVKDTFGNTINTVNEEITDPIDINYKMDKQLKATLGMRLNISIFKVFADYSIQDYGTLNTGISLSFK
ncbi:MAG TPA: hypothetical protein ENK67_01815 [Flavobacteriia bacterium]|nr:hypothetical protein [Flavobacteriia bacterium]